eukprot:TRINITY_DN10319_c0_g1_i1.p1 TRINITY_DN10319_c0_g1~~TRINITY_DN10319_c0_g1_i1.p1  ORF type:complete len:479 (+),score=193.41 TRINITY_DN10319_c0_g1_i1:164-1600(+)
MDNFEEIDDIEEHDAEVRSPSPVRMADSAPVAERHQVPPASDGPKLKILLGGLEDGMGQLIAKHLRDKGHYIRAWARRPENISTTAKGFVNDLVEEIAVKDDVCEGIDIVISAIGVRSLESAYLPREDEYQSNMLVLKAAMTSSSVKHFFLLSGIHADKIRKEVPHWEMREKVVDALREYSRYGTATMKWTVVRHSIFFHDLAEILDMIQKGERYVPGDGLLEMNPVHAYDFSAFLMKLIDNPPAGREIVVGGTSKYTVRDIYQLAIKIARRNPAFTSPCPVVYPDTKVTTFNKLLDKIPKISKEDPTKLTYVPNWAIAMGKMAFSQHAGILLTSLRGLHDQKLSAVAPTEIGVRKLEDFFASIYNGRPSRRQPGFVEVPVHSGSYFEYAVKVAEGSEGMTVEWEFGTEEFDIMFGTFYAPTDIAPKAVLHNLQRVESHLNNVKGQLVADKPGVYVLRWDNAHSFMRKKQLHYKITKR